MVVDRRHPEDALAGQFERDDLNDHAQGLDDEDSADYSQQDFLSNQDGNGAERATEGEGTDISHEEFRRRCIEPEKAESAADQGATDNRELSGAGNVLDLKIFGDACMAGCVGEHEKGASGDHHGADSESVESVGQVHRIARGDDDEGRQGDVEDSDVWREILEEGHGELRVEGGVVVDGYGDARRP